MMCNKSNIKKVYLLTESWTIYAIGNCNLLILFEISRFRLDWLVARPRLVIGYRRFGTRVGYCCAVLDCITLHCHFSFVRSQQFSNVSMYLQIFIFIERSDVNKLERRKNTNSGLSQTALKHVET